MYVFVRAMCCWSKSWWFLQRKASGSRNYLQGIQWGSRCFTGGEVKAQRRQCFTRAKAGLEVPHGERTCTPVHPQTPLYTHSVSRGDGLRWAGLQLGCSYSLAPSRCGYRLFAPSLGIGDGPLLHLLIPEVSSPSSAPQDLVAPTKPCPDFLRRRFWVQEDSLPSRAVFGELAGGVCCLASNLGNGRCHHHCPALDNVLVGRPGPAVLPRFCISVMVPLLFLFPNPGYRNHQDGCTPSGCRKPCHPWQVGDGSALPSLGEGARKSL